MFSKRKVHTLAAVAISAAATFIPYTATAIATDLTATTVEEDRIGKAYRQMPALQARLNTRVDTFKQQLDKARNLTALTQLVIRHGQGLWQDAVLDFATQNDYEDRALYWSRLEMSKALRQSRAFKQLLSSQQSKLMWKFELYTRGQKDVKFNRDADVRILLTGFDPFLLDRNIRQSNPSGVAALYFDDLFMSVEGKSIEIETLILPVRFADFDQGMVEELLTPYVRRGGADMVLTISMGRSGFDLERFPGLRRSAQAPDNLNVRTGASAATPLVPSYQGKQLSGPEFVEFSLPANAMQQATGKYKINDNRNVSTFNGKISATSLKQLLQETSVEGSGGGYLSNEISYRSILLREKYQPELPIGHIHTPRIGEHDQQVMRDIVSQIKAMIVQGSISLM